MQTMKDFCEWAGSQRKAAELLGVHESTISRACGDEGPSLDLARAVERASDGRFIAAALLGLIQSGQDRAA